MREYSSKRLTFRDVLPYLLVIVALVVLYFVFVYPKANSNTAAELSAKGELTYQAIGCDIKAPNLNATSKEYYLPGQPGYDKLNMATVLGGRWFCSEQDAISNGWTKAKA